jgi:hypothetical protein
MGASQAKSWVRVGTQSSGGGEIVKEGFTQSGEGRDAKFRTQEGQSKREGQNSWETEIKSNNPLKMRAILQRHRDT